MLTVLLLLQAVTSVNQAGGITTGSVNTVVNNKYTLADDVPEPQFYVSKPKPYICKNGERPLPTGAVITRCRAEFLGLPSDTEWYNPSPGVIVRRYGRCSSQIEWSKRYGGNGRMYDEADFLANRRPKQNARPCGKW